MSGKTLQQESVLGRLLSGEKPAEGEGNDDEPKENKPTDEIYIPSVVDAKEIQFFRYPRLGAFYGLGFKVKSYLSDKLFDQNYAKTDTFMKASEEYERNAEEEYAKYKEAYDDKANSGADEAELEQMEKEFEAKQAETPKPRLEDFDHVERAFVIGFDTLGKDKEISKQEQEKLRYFVDYLKKEWECKEIEYLKADISRNMKLMDKLEGPSQEAFAKLLEEEDRELPAHEEVEKVKDNEQLTELEMDTQRIEKLKEYFGDDKYLPYIEEICESKVLKYSDIVKYWLLFTGKKKWQINV